MGANQNGFVRAKADVISQGRLLLLIALRAGAIRSDPLASARSVVDCLLRPSSCPSFPSCPSCSGFWKLSLHRDRVGSTTNPPEDLLTESRAHPILSRV